MRDFEEQGEQMGQRSTVKDAFRFAGELGIELNIEHFRTVKTELRNCQVERLEEEVRNQRWQGSLVTATLQDEKVSGSACFWWLTEWKSSPTHTITRMFELWEQLLATRLNASQCSHHETLCRMCGKATGSHLIWERCAGTEQVPFPT